MRAKKSTFERKETWRNNVMADIRLSAAQKVFAMAVFSYAYGDKTECYPTYEQIAASMGSKQWRRFGDYGKALHDLGAMTRSHVGTDDKQRPNYTYRINLEWQPERVAAKSPVGTTPEKVDTPGENKAKVVTVNSHGEAYKVAQAEGCDWHFGQIYGEDVKRKDWDNILNEARAAKIESDNDEWL